MGNSRVCETSGIKIIMTNYPKILSAEYYKDLILKIHFSDNSLKYYNFKKLASKEVFSKLSNINFLKNFQIAPGGYALIWDDEIDIAESELWINGTTTPKNNLVFIE